MPDFKFTAEDIIAEGDKVVARYKWNGTHTGTYRSIAPTGKKVNVENIGIFRMAKGRINEFWFVVDAYGLMQQIGAIPGGPPKK